MIITAALAGVFGFLLAVVLFKPIHRDLVAVNARMTTTILASFDVLGGADSRREHLAYNYLLAELRRQGVIEQTVHPTRRVESERLAPYAGASYDPDEAYDRDREDRALEGELEERNRSHDLPIPDWKDPDDAMDEARDMGREIARERGGAD